MKSIVLSLLVIFSITVISCNNDDDNQEMADVIIGSWKLSGIENAGVPATLDECELKSTYLFTAPDVFKLTNYEFDDSEAECVIESEGSGTWKNSGNNKYELTVGGDAITLLEATFTDDNTTLTFTVKQDGEDDQVFTFKK